MIECKVPNYNKRKRKKMKKSQWKNYFNVIFKGHLSTPVSPVR